MSKADRNDAEHVNILHFWRLVSKQKRLLACLHLETKFKLQL